MKWLTGLLALAALPFVLLAWMIAMGAAAWLVTAAFPIIIGALFLGWLFDRRAR